MKVSIRSALAFCFGVLLAGCCTAQSLPEPGLNLTEKGSGKKITLKRGSTVKITLVSNPTTGYGWTFFLPADGALQTLQDDFVAPESNGMTGVPGKHVFTVRAVKPGKHNLLGFYYRPWEKLNPAKDDCFQLTIEVKD